MKLKRYIQLRGYTMTQVCDKCGINLSSLSLHVNERKMLSKEHCQKIADFLDITFAEVKNNDVHKKLQWYDYSKEEKSQGSTIG